MYTTIKSKNYSADFEYFVISKIKRKIADNISDEVGAHYREAFDIRKFAHNQDYINEYKKKSEQLANKYQCKEIFGFLYQNEVEGKISVKSCKKIYEAIKDLGEDVNGYHYAARDLDDKYFREFKKLLKDCIDNNSHLEWY